MKDWRKEGCVGSVRLQSNTCSDTWAFGTVESLAGVQCVTIGGKLIAESAQQLIDCSKAYGNRGCDGGDPITCKNVETENLIKFKISSIFY